MDLILDPAQALDFGREQSDWRLATRGRLDRPPAPTGLTGGGSSLRGSGKCVRRIDGRIRALVVAAADTLDLAGLHVAADRRGGDAGIAQLLRTHDGGPDEWVTQPVSLDLGHGGHEESSDKVKVSHRFCDMSASETEAAKSKKTARDSEQTHFPPA